MLERFHKQKRPSRFKKKYKELNQTLNLNLNVNDDQDLLKLSIYDVALNQKQFFENQFESVRNDCFDMWDHLSFYEKNDLILLDTNKEVHQLNSFDYKDVNIYIPFFNKMLNSLYATEIAVLEKPQFFKLYREFKESMIDMKQYGLDPYIHGFTYCQVVNFDAHQVVLFDDVLKIFYKIDNEFKRFPLLEDVKLTETQIKEVAKFIAEDETEELYAFVVAQNLVSKRFIKRYNKLKRKEKKQAERKKKHENK